MILNLWDIKMEKIFTTLIMRGKHDISTWATAMPEFLKWGWGK